MIVPEGRRRGTRKLSKPKALAARTGDSHIIPVDTVRLTSTWINDVQAIAVHGTSFNVGDRGAVGKEQ